LIRHLNIEIDHIIEGCRKKDPRAQRMLYEQYSSRMYGVCLRYSNSTADAQDTLHEGFLKIFEKIGQFESRGAFEGWIRRIMVNTALEKFRNKYKIIELQENITDFDSQDEHDISGNLTVQEIMKMIDELSPQYKIVFNLYAIEGYSHKEISEKLNISEGTSKSNLSRARAILQEKVNFFYNHSIRTGTAI
jgi:RNA polymerase sigma factor (sigma-70 family)